MAQTESAPFIRVFDTYPEAHAAILALEQAGIGPRLISVVTRSPHEAETLENATGASDDVEEAAYRSRFTEFADWLGRVGSVAVPGLGSVLGTGDVWQDVALAGRGHGSITGALVGCGVPVDQAEQLEAAVFAGRILVLVHGAYDIATVEQVLG